MAFAAPLTWRRMTRSRWASFWTRRRSGVEAWFAKYGSMPPELTKALEAASDVPVDIDPIFAFPEPMR